MNFRKFNLALECENCEKDKIKSKTKKDGNIIIILKNTVSKLLQDIQKFNTNDVLIFNECDINDTCFNMLKSSDIILSDVERFISAKYSWVIYTDPFKFLKVLENIDENTINHSYSDFELHYRNGITDNARYESNKTYTKKINNIDDDDMIRSYYHNIIPRTKFQIQFNISEIDFVIDDVCLVFTFSCNIDKPLKVDLHAYIPTEDFILKLEKYKSTESKSEQIFECDVIANPAESLEYNDISKEILNEDMAPFSDKIWGFIFSIFKRNKGENKNDN